MLELLRAAAQLLGAPATALVDVLAPGFPRPLERRPGQLLRAAGATPEDLDALLRAAGFADLDDLRRQALREHGRSRPARLLADADPGNGHQGALERALLREQDNLARTLRALQGSGALEVAARAVLTSRRRWVFGDLKSRGYAQLFAADLTAALNQVTLVEPSAAAVAAAAGDARQLDSLTVFSFRRYSRLTVRLAEQFAARGASVIAVTDSDTGPVCAHAQHVLRVITRSDSTAHSPVAVTATGHTLAALVASGAKGAARRTRYAQELALAMEWYAE